MTTVLLTPNNERLRLVVYQNKTVIAFVSTFLTERRPVAIFWTKNTPAVKPIKD